MQEVHYIIDGGETVELREEAAAALRGGKNVVKVVRYQYQTGPTTVILATLTEIKKVTDL